MLGVLRRLLLVLVSSSLVACTTTRVVAQGQEASLAALGASPALGDPRDAVTVVTHDGTRHVLRLKSVSTESVAGTSLDNKQSILIPAADVQRVEVDEVNTRAIAITVVVALVVIVAGAISASKSLAKSLSGTPPSPPRVRALAVKLQ